MIRRPRRRAAGFLLAAAAATVRCGDEAAGPPVDTSAPVIRIASPREGSAFTYAVACSATASDDRGVAWLEFRVHPIEPAGALQTDSVVALSGPISAPPFEWLWSVEAAPNGGYAIVCEAADAAGNAARDTVRIELQGDRWVPVVTITSPFEASIVKGIVPVIVEAVDDSPIDSLWVEIRTGDVTVLPELVFTNAPYSLSWDTRLLPQGTYRVSARARDRAGNASSIVSNSVRAYPRAVLQYDDGTVESGRGDPTFTWQMAAVFHNPYDIAVVVDTLWVFIHETSPIGGGFRFALWNVVDGRPTSEVQGTRQLFVRSPRGTWGYFPGWSTLVPVGGSIAAGWQRTGQDATVLGMDQTSPFLENTFFFTIPAGAETWIPFETLGYIEVPMIRLHVSAFTGKLPVPLSAAAVAYETLDPDRAHQDGRLRAGSE